MNPWPVFIIIYSIICSNVITTCILLSVPFPSQKCFSFGDHAVSSQHFKSTCLSGTIDTKQTKTLKGGGNMSVCGLTVEMTYSDEADHEAAVMNYLSWRNADT